MHPTILTKYLSYICIFLLCLTSVNAQVRRGVPYMQHYSSKKYKGGAQNWTIQQQQNGLLYFGNANGLLEYDGHNWNQINIASKSVARSIAIDESGRLYVGAQADFGYVKGDSIGRASFYSLKQHVPQEYQNFEGVSSTFITSEKDIFFQTAKAIFIWNKKECQAIVPDSLFHLSFQLKEEILVQEKGKGLLLYKNKGVELVPQGAYYKDKSIQSITTYSDQEYLVFCEGELPHILNKNTGERKRWECELAEELVERSVHTSLSISQQQIALGTANGLFIYHINGKLQQLIDKGNSSLSSAIWALYMDQQGDLWMGLDDGIERLTLSSPLSIFGKGEVQGLLSATVFQDYLYLATTNGVYRTKWAEVGFSRAKLEHVEGLDEQAWELKVIDGTLFCAHSKGLFTIEGTKASQILKQYCWTVKQWDTNENRLLVGTYRNGLLVLEKRNGQWQFKHAIAGFKESARYVVQKANEIWVSHAYKGVFHLTLNGEDASTVHKMRVITDKEGLPSLYNFLYEIDGQLLLGTEKGVYSWNEQKQFSPYAPLQEFKEQLQNVSKLVKGLNESLWVYADKKVYKLLKKGGDKYKLYEVPSVKLNDLTLYSISPLSEDQVLFGSANQSVFYQQSIGQHSPLVLYPIIRKVYNTSQTKDLLYGGMKVSSKNPSLDYEQNSILFEYAIPYYDESESVQYQYYLEGLQDSWSDWSVHNEKEYTNLAPGAYKFRLRAKNSQGQTSKECVYRFEVKTPWYKTVYAYGALGVLVLVCLKLAFMVYAASLRRKNEQLERIVHKRTEEVRNKNKELQLQKDEIEHQKEEIESQNEAIGQQNEELKQLNEEKNMLISMLSHDMRNPLTQIKGLVMINKMMAPDMDEKLLEHHVMIEAAAERLNEMISQILDIEAVEANTVKMKLEEVNMSVMLDQAVASFEASAEKKNIELVKKIDLDKYFFSEVDKNYALQVVENLISNAIKFSPADKKIYITIEELNGRVRASVKDEGPGLSKEDMSKLFGKFQKLSARPTAGESSTGLGLSIVKKYVEHMNGKVWCESTLGQGACFIVEYPLLSVKEAS